MFDSQSRYSKLTPETMTAADGTVITYTSRRFLPQGDALPVLQQVTVIAGDRIDLVTSRTLRDPTQFWRICDANDAMDPLDLADVPGAILVVPIPGPITGT